MYCISINYRKADIEIRRKVKFSDEECAKISKELINNQIVTECVVLSTCNRTEVYFCGKNKCEKTVLKKIAESADISEELLSKYAMNYFGDSAVLHLFKVASGIDSMIIGEDEILGQTKNAYAIALENNTAAYQMNMIFQAAISCAKKIKTQTPISKTSVSVATLTANEAAKLGEKVSVLVIGASGKIGTTVLKNLASHKNISVRATMRKHTQNKLLKELNIEAVDYDSRYDYINSADCIISATSSPHYTVTFYDLKDRLIDRKNRLFIDLAVPPDIDNSIAKLDGVKVINIDYFEQLAKDNNTLKLSSLDTAEEIISTEIDTLKKDLIFHDFLPELNSVRNNFESENKSFEKLVYKMKAESSADTFREFIRILQNF